jgi:hypothetical protein
MIYKSIIIFMIFNRLLISELLNHKNNYKNNFYLLINTKPPEIPIIIDTEKEISIYKYNIIKDIKNKLKKLFWYLFILIIFNIIFIIITPFLFKEFYKYFIEIIMAVLENLNNNYYTELNSIQTILNIYKNHEKKNENSLKDFIKTKIVKQLIDYAPQISKYINTIVNDPITNLIFSLNNLFFYFSCNTFSTLLLGFFILINLIIILLANYKDNLYDKYQITSVQTKIKLLIMDPQNKNNDINITNKLKLLKQENILKKKYFNFFYCNTKYFNSINFIFIIILYIHYINFPDRFKEFQRYNEYLENKNLKNFQWNYKQFNRKYFIILLIFFNSFSFFYLLKKDYLFIKLYCNYQQSLKKFCLEILI